MKMFYNEVKKFWKIFIIYSFVDTDNFCKRKRIGIYKVTAYYVSFGTHFRRSFLLLIL